jgi:hypothetical protein
MVHKFELFHVAVHHSLRLLSYQRGVYYSGAQLFNILLTSITASKNDKRCFKLVLRKYLQDNSFYSIEEFAEHAKGLKG